MLEPVQAASASFFTREEGLRQEVSRLEDRIRALEDEKTELMAASSDHTRPLMRRASLTITAGTQLAHTLQPDPACHCRFLTRSFKV